MQLEFYCPNSGTKLFKGSFDGWGKIVCHKCKAKLIIRGNYKRYIVKAYRLYNPHTLRKRDGSKIILHCPHCGKAVQEVCFDSRFITNCPICDKKVNIKATKEEIYILIKKEKP